MVIFTTIFLFILNLIKHNLCKFYILNSPKTSVDVNLEREPNKLLQISQQQQQQQQQLLQKELEQQLLEKKKLQQQQQQLIQQQLAAQTAQQIPQSQQQPTTDLVRSPKLSYTSTTTSPYISS